MRQLLPLSYKPNFYCSVLSINPLFIPACDTLSSQASVDPRSDKNINLRGKDYDWASATRDWRPKSHQQLIFPPSLLSDPHLSAWAFWFIPLLLQTNKFLQLQFQSPIDFFSRLFSQCAVHPEFQGFHFTLIFVFPDWFLPPGWIILLWQRHSSTVKWRWKIRKSGFRV